MRKTHKTTKVIVWFILLQLLIVIPVFLLYNSAKNATENNTQSTVFYADFVEFVRKPTGDNRGRIVVLHDSDEYIYHFYEHIKEDETIADRLRTQQLTIRYFPENGTIVDIRSKDYVFYTIDAYNDSRRPERIAVVCCWIILEMLYGIALCFFSMTTPRGYRFFRYIRKKQIKKTGKKGQSVTSNN